MAWTSYVLIRWWWLKQQFTGSHVALLWHIVLIHSQCNQSLFLFCNAACLAEKQHMPSTTNCAVSDLTQPGFEPPSTTFEADTITITHQGGLYLSLFMLHSNTQKANLPYISNGKVYSIQHYVIKCVSDLRKVCGFLRIHRFPPSITLTALKWC
jgi:hypothetical protein